MALVEQQASAPSLVLSPSPESVAHHREHDPDDIEDDELLRGLRLDEWFVTARADVPIWWH